MGASYDNAEISRLPFTGAGPDPAPRTRPSPRLGWDFTTGIYKPFRSLLVKKKMLGSLSSEFSDPAKITVNSLPSGGILTLLLPWQHISCQDCVSLTLST